MDLNQLYFDHQLLLIGAQRTPSPRLRREREITASHVAGRIGCMQRAVGASAAPAWEALASSGLGSLAGPGRHQQGHAW